MLRSNLPSILVLEDEFLIAEFLRDDLEAHGVAVTLTETVAEARALRLSSFDAAILDVSLPDGKSWPVADALTSSGIPFAFRTSAQGIPLRAFPAIATFDKFSSAAELLDAVGVPFMIPQRRLAVGM